MSHEGTLKKSPSKGPSSREAGERGCFGQCSGKEGTGLGCVAGEHALERGLSGAREEEEEEDGGEACRVGLFFAPLSHQNVIEASHFGLIISKSKYLRKVGTFSETGQVREHSKEQS